MRSRAVIACFLLGACSFTVGGPPSHYQPRRFTPPPECTESFAGRALLDLAGIAASLFIARLAYGFCYPEDGCEPMPRAAPYVGLAALYAAGIGYGVITTERCSKARALHDAVQLGLELDE
jgi:hypothetical protein